MWDLEVRRVVPLAVDAAAVKHTIESSRLLLNPE